MRVAIFLALAPLSATGLADELKMGVPHAELVKARCTLCHEAGHFVRLKQDRAAWEDTVELMIRRGAPIEPQEKPLILDYLVTHYGPDSGNTSR